MDLNREEKIENCLNIYKVLNDNRNDLNIYKLQKKQGDIKIKLENLLEIWDKFLINFESKVNNK